LVCMQALAFDDAERNLFGHHQWIQSGWPLRGAPQHWLPSCMTKACTWSMQGNARLSLPGEASYSLLACMFIYWTVCLPACRPACLPACCEYGVTACSVQRAALRCAAFNFHLPKYKCESHCAGACLVGRWRLWCSAGTLKYGLEHMRVSCEQAAVSRTLMMLTTICLRICFSMVAAPCRTS